MTLLLFTVLVRGGFAADLVGSCPTLDSPDDALPWKEPGELGTEDLFDRLLAQAEAWVDPSCLVDCVTAGDPETGCDDSTCTTYTCEEAACTTAEGAVVSWRATALSRSGSDSGYASNSDLETWTVEVTLPDGLAGWTALALSATRSEGSGAGRLTSSRSSARDWTASWTGAVDAALPADGALVASVSEHWDSYGRRDASEAIDDGTCAWTVDWSRYEDSTVFDEAWDVGVNDQALAIRTVEDCFGNRYYYATLDGGGAVRIDPVTWAPTADTDADGDGWSVEMGDCDDADPATMPCDGVEVVNDGVDQDCWDGDAIDADGDGDWARETGGRDCDDADPTVYDGATEVPYDGVDQDCDGEDLVDVDGDGFVATEAGGDDCDDADRTVHPRAEDDPADGVDQDCDGADARFVGFEGPPFPALPRPEPHAPAEDAGATPSRTGGCFGTHGASSAAALLLVPLLARRRRSLSPDTGTLRPRTGDLSDR